MSFSVRSIGKKPNVVAHLATQLEKVQEGPTVLAALKNLLEPIGDEKSLDVTASGNLSSYGGAMNCTITNSTLLPSVFAPEVVPAVPPAATPAATA